jgi:hypothetical protein
MEITDMEWKGYKACGWKQRAVARKIAKRVAVPVSFIARVGVSCVGSVLMIDTNQDRRI